MTKRPQLPVFCAIDTTDVALATAWVGVAAAAGFGIKIGKEFFAAHGPAAVRRLRPDGIPLFLDLKLHDIPNTVAGAVRALVASVAPTFLTVHASGGRAMLQAAVDAAGSDTGILAVTVLTSLSADDLAATGIVGTAQAQVLRLAQLSAQCGVAGVVAAAHEIVALRQALSRSIKLVIPGIRLPGAAADDQKRVMGPAEALLLGADWLVIGRPITQARDPQAAATDIARMIAPAA